MIDIEPATGIEPKSSWYMIKRNKKQVLSFSILLTSMQPNAPMLIVISLLCINLKACYHNPFTLSIDGVDCISER